ncbi:MAG: peptidylprolyl isomerase [Planctomycetota bacterium]|jgi:peptidyl-prolyl cis-trans isomerase C
MMRLFSGKSAALFLGLLIALCHLCAARQSGQKSKEQSVVKPAAGPSNVVAKIGDYIITSEELEKRLIRELRPDDYDDYNEQAEPVEAKTVLMKMIAEKAMATEARKEGYLEEEMTHASIKRYKQRRLVNLLVQKRLQGKVTVTDAEIKAKMKTDPKLDQARAEAMLKNTKMRTLFEQYYRQIYEKFHVKKLTDNFPKAVEIHQRLLLRPKTPRKMPFIRIIQIRDELTPEEKNIILATYEHGKVTLKDWFETLCESAPPSRPRDLNTVKGVERLIERTLSMPLLVSEAELLGFDKDKNLLKQVREYEDMRLLSQAKLAKYKEVKDPTTEEIAAYYEKNKEVFRTRRTLKIDQIWCQNLKTAGKVKTELDRDEDFESAREKYSLEKKSRPFNTAPGGEGMFWEDLWKADPNEIIGPIKGFYRDGFKWRIVKILEKNPGEVKEYSNNMENRVKGKMVAEQRDALLEKYGKELLGKYPYEIYADRIKDINPLDIP